MTDSNKAVFLSYASEDREAAIRIGEALQAAGVEVWFDQTELRGGDLWDAKIRGQIKTCALFVPLISNNTRARHEGYFRLEWKLAVDRSHLMSEEKAFLVPVAIDGSSAEHESVPDRFREVQWSQLQHGVPSPAFVDRVKHLLSQPVVVSSPGPALTAATSKPSQADAQTHGVSMRWIALGMVLIAASAIAAYHYLPIFQKSTLNGNVDARAAPALQPSEHSIAVMPFANISGDPSQEYFSDGLSEELRTSLARLQGLQVASRISSMSLEVKPGTSAEIGQKLHVAALLEGSVRRYDNKVRISVQLVDAKSGFEVWSQSFDRDIKDVLALQSEIAKAVAQGLQVKLVGNIADAVEAGGTANPEAFDLLLRATEAAHKMSQQSLPEALSLVSEAIRLDPAYANAYAQRSEIEANLAGIFDPTERIASRKADARRDIEHAIELAPNVSLFHGMYGNYFSGIFLNFPAAQKEFERARELAPDSVDIIGGRAKLAGYFGHRSEAVSLTQRIVQLNSPNAIAYANGAEGLAAVALYEDSLKFDDRAITLGYTVANYHRCAVLVWLRRDEEAISRCSDTDIAQSQAFVVVALLRTNRQKRADAMLQKIMKEQGDAAAYEYALIDSQRGDTNGALKWLEKAYELQDGSLLEMKQEQLFDPIRKEPRFQGILKKLNFPP
jgi:TolB-like protein